MANLLAAAQWYAERDVPVFPIVPRGKNPLVEKGFYQATTDADKIKEWWTEYPDANIGTPTGIKFDAVDVDSDEGRKVLAGMPELKVIGRQRTPRINGGEHLLVPVTGYGPKTSKYFHPGVDYRGVGSYIVLAPSIGLKVKDHPELGYAPYKWIQRPESFPDIEPDLAHPLYAPFRAKEEPESGTSLLGRDLTEFVDIVDHDAVKELHAAAWAMYTEPEGNRNHVLNALCFKVGRLIGAGRLDETEAVDTMYRAAIAAGLGEGEISATLKSGISAGKKDPKYRTSDAPEETPTGPTSGRVNFYEEWDKAEDDIPWIIWPIVAERRLTALYSVPKVGKSLLALDAVIKVSKGEPFLGHEPINGPVTVLYLDKENDVRGDVIQRAKNMGYEAKDFDNIAYYSFHDLPSMDTEAGGKKVLALAQEHNAGLVVVDTVSRHVAGEENSNDTWLAWYRCTGALLKQHGIACIRIDHAGKDAAKGQRGGSSKSGDVDMIWQMSLTREDVVRLKLDSQRMQVPKEYRDITVERVTDPLRHEVIEDTEAPFDEINELVRKARSLGLTSQSSINQFKSALGVGYEKAKAVKARLVETEGRELEFPIRFTNHPPLEARQD